MTVDWAWTPYAVVALVGGWLIGTLLYERNRARSDTPLALILAGIMILVLAFFNVFGSFALAANAAASSLFVAAARLRSLQKRNDSSSHSSRLAPSGR